MNYYNEIDPKAAAWLRELIRAGEIPNGTVDERSIADVLPNDLLGFSQCHFFAGIGGWPLALKLAGWPEDAPVWTGSCPCQPFSVAGKGRGTDDERHLWPEFFRLIRERRPATVFGEQVASAAGRGWLAGVLADLESVGYAGAGSDLCAAGVGAPHIRQRLFWGAGWLADPEHTERRSEHQEHGEAHGRDGSRRGSTALRLADADRGQCDGLPDGQGCQCDRQATAWQQGNGEPECGCSTRGLVHSQRPRLEGFIGNGHDGHEPGRLGAKPGGSTATASPTGFWSAFDIIPCRDGKARRIEPASFPLAHGVSGRMGLLRGYGNAIVPQVAAEFIQAWQEAAGA